MDKDNVVENTLKLQRCLQNFIAHVDDLRNEDDPSGDGFTREFRVGVVSTLCFVFWLLLSNLCHITWIIAFIISLKFSQIVI